MAANVAVPQQEQSGHGRPRSKGYRPRDDTKTARFLALVQDNHGPLACLALPDVYRISLNLAPEAGIHAGSARKALRAAIIAAQDSAT